MENKPTLHFISGKLGSGKTTLARKIAKENNAIFISEDVWLEKFYPGEIHDFKDYLRCSRRFREMMAKHVNDLFNIGISVVFDFAGNVPQERSWVKNLIDQAKVNHLLHYIDASDDLCRLQFKKRNLELPEGSKFVTDEEFNAINQYFIPPEPSEGFAMKIHKR